MPPLFHNRAHRALPAFRPLALTFFLALLSPAVFAGNVRVEVKDLKNLPVADAVASLTPLDAPPAITPPAEPVVITQEKEEFQPYVTVVAAGTRIRFPNTDKVQHHVFSLSKTKTFDLGLYRGEPRELVTFDRPGVVTLGCNIHDWMAAYVVVLATPHFKKTAADGLAPIASLPSGRYRLEIWHPRIKAIVTRELTVDESPATQVISVTLGVDRRIRRAPESGTGAYK
jgi:plastocyanin